jgi:ribosomal protein L34
MDRRNTFGARAARILTAVLITSALTGALVQRGAAAQSAHRTFASAEEAVRALADAVKRGNLDEVVAIFGPDGQDLASSSDPATGQRNREVFTAAFAEGWRLVSQGANRRTLVIGNEGWPFPVPLLKEGTRWRFDTKAGKEEVIARRIGRNELAAIAVCRTYVSAQVRYALDGHDGKPAGLYASTFRSDPGRQNGLYWAASHGQKRSPLGDLVAEAAADGQSLAEHRDPSPYHGYYFRILTAQGSHVIDGARSYIVDGKMSGGFALVAWPAQYDATGVMTFVVNQNGMLWQKDLGAGTDAAARAMTAYDPDVSWHSVR